MGDTEHNSNDLDENSSSWMRNNSKKALWRVSAFVTWVWAIFQFLQPQGYWLFLASLSGWHIAAVNIAAMGMYMLVKAKKGAGCLALLFYPVYLLVFPFYMIYVIYKVWSAVFTPAFHPKDAVSALIPYIITIISAAYILYFEVHSISWFVVCLLLVNITIVLFSLVAWIFVPLHWASGVIVWLIDKAQEYAFGKVIPLEEDLLANNSSSEDQLKQAIDRLKTIHDSIRNIPGINSRFVDPVLLVGFSRKFFVSVVHVGIIFALIHFVVNNHFETPSYPYDYLPQGTLYENGFDYFYFATMTLIASDTGIVATAEVSRIFVMLNAFVGVSFLVLLITTFSMLTRERARRKVEEISKTLDELVGQVESKLVLAASVANRTGQATGDVLKKLTAVKGFTRIEDQKADRFNAVLTLNKAIKQLQAQGPSKELGELLAARKEFTDEMLSKLGERINSMDKPISPHDLVEEIRRFYFDPPENPFDPDDDLPF